MSRDPQLTGQVVNLGTTAEPPAPPPRPPSPAPPELDEEALASRFWVLVEGRWLLGSVVVLVLAIAVGYLLLATPTYRSTATLQVEDRNRNLAGLDALSALLGEKAPAETEIEIIRSRALLRGVIDELGLDLRVEPRRFPLVGGAFARAYRAVAPAPARFGQDGYAWGGERITVKRLDVDDELLDRPLTITALPGQRLALSGEGISAEGAVDKPLVVTGRHRVQLFVSELVARPGVRFTVVKRNKADVVDALLRDLQVTEKGKKTGVLVLSLDGTDAARTAAILDAISRSYVRQNVDRKSAEAVKTLEFLETQLPLVKSNLDSAQAAMRAFQVGSGSVDLTNETSKVLDRSVEIDKALQDLELQRAELRQKFTPNHPAFASLNDKAQQLRAERQSVDARLRRIPAAESDSARLQRDVKSASELYGMLLNKAQELRVMKSGTVGNVRVLDEATVPRRPVTPNPPLVLGIAAVLALFGGVAAVFVRRAFDQSTSDPDDIESGTGLPVYATVPHAPAPRAGELLAIADPGHTAIESLRSLRTSLQFALFDARNNVVAITGPTPGVGKTFVSANLAHVLASPERRVLLVDCDLRRGTVHRSLNVQRQPGVSDVVSGVALIADAVRHTTHPQLDVLPAGRVPPNPAELLASQAFARLVGWASSNYDLVVIDTPPVLAVSDAIEVARLAGVNLVVLRAGHHSLREIKAAAKRYAQAGFHLQGAVLNDVRAALGRYGRHGRYQRYEYRASNESRGGHR